MKSDDTPKDLKKGANEKKGDNNKGGGSAAPSSGMDAHPFARGSVIEVLYGVKEEDEGKKKTKEFWWSDSDASDDDDDMEIEGDEGKGREKGKGEGGEEEGDKKATTVVTTTTSVRLCDVIDRVADEDGKWRYYIHYRDFNRRMDEWIGMDRIVSPPSVGNSKARALKKLEEKQKKRKQSEEKAAMSKSSSSSSSSLTSSDLRNSRRRSSDALEGGGGAGGVADADTPRMTRRQRRKSSVVVAASQPSDDATVVTSNRDSHDKRPMSPAATMNTTTGSSSSSLTAQQQQPQQQQKQQQHHAHSSGAALAVDNKELVQIATTAKAETMIGQHVVATIPAQELDEHEGLDEASLREHEEVTKVKNCAFIELGEFQMETWYFSPLPKELLSEKGFIEVLYVCEFSFRLFARKSELLRYQARELPKNRRHPPGNEIYRNGNLSMFEVDGYEERIYCQNLCYIAKLFLDHKTLYFDVDPFLFYVLCEVDNRGFHPVGYYSKEKYSDVGYNLACILTFPSHQRKGYGRFLIAFSYELSKKEEKVGSPEKPMSDLGQQAYKPYWMSTIVDFLLLNDASSMSIMDISKKTSIMAEDIVFTLNQLGILKIINGVYFIAAERSLLEKLAKKHPIKKPRVDPTKLHWTPFVTDVKRDKFSIHSKKPSVDKDTDAKISIAPSKP